VPQDTAIRKERELAALFVISHTPARMLLILIIGDGASADEIWPIINVIAIVNDVVAVPHCLGERR